jgi:hypothetical protein
MRAAVGAVVIAFFVASTQARAEEAVLSCAVEESGPNHAHRTWELRFDQKNQLVFIAKIMSTAAISDAKISFRVDLGNGVPLSFTIDRASGFIRVTGGSGSLYSGQCTPLDPARR